MLKKVHIFEPEKSLARETLQCSMCEAALTKTVLYVCESGHVVCEACRTPDDGTPEVKNKNAMTARSEFKALNPACGETNEVCHKDLASGDHQHTLNRETRPECKSFCDIKQVRKLTNNRHTFSEGAIFSNNKEITLKYKNDNFCESDSSVFNPIINEQEKEEFEIHHIQRPVTCPVTDCHKIIARDSVLQHFYFDHSKVPRITIKETEHHEIFIQLSSITEKLLCHAVFLVKSDTSLPHAGSSTLVNGGYKNSSFLLMGARMPSPAETIKKARGSESVYIRHVQTQTGAVKIKSSKVHLKTDISTNYIQDDLQIDNNNGAIMLWICKLSDISYFYSISVTKPDKKFGFSVTGETINIRDSQDCQVIWNQFDYLHIRKKNLQKLINNKDQLEININIFQ